MQAEALAATATAELAASEVLRWRTSAERAHVAMREGVERSETATEVRLILCVTCHRLALAPTGLPPHTRCTVTDSHRPPIDSTIRWLLREPGIEERGRAPSGAPKGAYFGTTSRPC